MATNQAIGGAFPRLVRWFGLLQASEKVNLQTTPYPVTAPRRLEDERTNQSHLPKLGLYRLQLIVELRQKIILCTLVMFINVTRTVTSKKQGSQSWFVNKVFMWQFVSSSYQITKWKNDHNRPSICRYLISCSNLFRVQHMEHTSIHRRHPGDVQRLSNTRHQLHSNPR